MCFMACVGSAVQGDIQSVGSLGRSLDLDFSVCVSNITQGRQVIGLSFTLLQLDFLVNIRI